jgi:tRNA A37 N6-isopentenylltransferase MiaA
VKIIGSTGSSCVLVEMTHREFARIAGFSYESELEKLDYDRASQYHRSDSYKVGRELEVSPIYDRLIAQQQVAGRLNDAAKNLRAIADLTECVAPALELLTEDGGAK